MSAANPDYNSISPSVYVVYTDIAGHGECGPVGRLASVTVGYAPSEVRSYHPDSDAEERLEPINYADLWSNCTSRAADYTAPLLDCFTKKGFSTDAACMSQQYEIYASESALQRQCYPLLSYPGGLHTVNKAWATCHSSSWGPNDNPLFDPPMTLGRATVMAPVQTQDTGLLESTTAAPASVHSDQLPLETEFRLQRRHWFSQEDLNQIRLCPVRRP